MHIYTVIWRAYSWILILFSKLLRLFSRPRLQLENKLTLILLMFLFWLLRFSFSVTTVFAWIQTLIHLLWQPNRKSKSNQIRSNLNPTPSRSDPTQSKSTPDQIQSNLIQPQSRSNQIRSDQIQMQSKSNSIRSVTNQIPTRSDPIKSRFNPKHIQTNQIRARSDADPIRSVPDPRGVHMVLN